MMSITLQELGDLVSKTRGDRRLTQDALAQRLGQPFNRSVVAHLEQGIRLPSAEMLARLCSELQIAEQFWRPFQDPEVQDRLHFESLLSELVGFHISLRFLDQMSMESAHNAVIRLLRTDFTLRQSFDAFNTVLVFYGVDRVGLPFFERFLGPDAFKSIHAFEQHVRTYQRQAIRQFQTFRVAFQALREHGNVASALPALDKRSDEHYRARAPWDQIETIPDAHLPDLGYISAEKVQKEQVERRTVSNFLRELAEKIRKSGKPAVESNTEKKRSQMDSLLRKFGSSIQHGFLSPLFVPDSDALLREAEVLAPKEAGDISRMKATQGTAEKNLARYLSADHMDVYVATSMRTDADFVSVNAFVSDLFSHDRVRPLKLRYFNPTQSWIEDRIAKGLVEALMLRRAQYTIYMAQKGDTFGKDSEASVALGQGKPVIVFVPRLYVPDVDVDSASVGLQPRDELRRILANEGTTEDRDVDETVDDQALVGRILGLRLQRASDLQLSDAAARHWADFDLYGESGRIDDSAREEYRKWLDAVVKAKNRAPIPASLREPFVRVLVAVATRFEQRAKTFREIHPLALQVILSSGVLNGMLVVRSVESCAELLRGLITNELEFTLDAGESNYRLIEKSTGSTLRVISKHRLITSAFSTFYTKEPA